MLLWLLRYLPYIAGALALAGAVFGIHHHGYNAGKAHEQALQARANAKAVAAMEKARTAIDALNGQLAAAQTAQQTTFKEIYHESVKIIDRPVFQRICGDADAAKLFDRARAAANADPSGESAHATPGDASHAP